MKSQPEYNPAGSMSCIERECDPGALSLLDRDLHPVAARVVAGRVPPGMKDPLGFLQASLADLENPDLLPDGTKAAERIVRAIQNDEVIALCSDHDSDGLSGGAVMYVALTRLFGCDPAKVHLLNTHRLKEGYGVSLAMAGRILRQKPVPTLVITSDQGSSDREGVALLSNHGMDVIVTDHHTIHDDLSPESAYAFVNVQRKNSHYKDKNIAGGMTAWLVMAIVRTQLAKQGGRAVPKGEFLGLLDYVALSTLVDCVSMASINNRAVVRHGINLIKTKPRPCWRALDSVRRSAGPVTSETMVFDYGPRITSRGRMDESGTGARFLVEQDYDECLATVSVLDAENTERKIIEQTMRDKLRAQATDQVVRGECGICLYDVDSHSGIQGISSSRFGEEFGMPVISFAPSPRNPDELQASGRAVLAHFDLKVTLDTIAKNNPGLGLRHGGHRAACGGNLPKNKFIEFTLEWHKLCRQALRHTRIGPRIMTDGSLGSGFLNDDCFLALDALGPFGKGFEYPVFVDDFMVKNVTGIGKDGLHLKMTLVIDNVMLPAIWFNARKTAAERSPIVNNSVARVAYQVRRNWFRGKSQWQLQVVALLDAVL